MVIRTASAELSQEDWNNRAAQEREVRSMLDPRRGATTDFRQKDACGRVGHKISTVSTIKCRETTCDKLQNSMTGEALSFKTVECFRSAAARYLLDLSN